MLLVSWDLQLRGKLDMRFTYSQRNQGSEHVLTHRKRNMQMGSSYHVDTFLGMLGEKCSRIRKGRVMVSLIFHVNGQTQWHFISFCLLTASSVSEGSSTYSTVSCSFWHIHCCILC